MDEFSRINTSVGEGLTAADIAREHLLRGTRIMETPEGQQYITLTPEVAARLQELVLVRPAVGEQIVTYTSTGVWAILADRPGTTYNPYHEEVPSRFQRYDENDYNK
mgnify:CR=1 FL=1